MSRLGSLYVHLPPESRSFRSQQADADPAGTWSESDWMLWGCEYSLRCLVWQQGGCKGRRPRPLPTPEDRARRARQLEGAEEARAAVDEVLASVLTFQGGGGPGGEEGGG